LSCLALTTDPAAEPWMQQISGFVGAVVQHTIAAEASYKSSVDSLLAQASGSENAVAAQVISYGNSPTFPLVVSLLFKYPAV
jgi:hypothetical protein